MAVSLLYGNINPYNKSHNAITVVLDLLMIMLLVNVLFLLIILCRFQHVLLEQDTII